MLSRQLLTGPVRMQAEVKLHGISTSPNENGIFRNKYCMSELQLDLVSQDIVVKYHV